jgi:hypothetical protein
VNIVRLLHVPDRAVHVESETIDQPTLKRPHSPHAAWHSSTGAASQAPTLSSATSIARQSHELADPFQSHAEVVTDPLERSAAPPVEPGHRRRPPARLEGHRPAAGSSGTLPRATMASTRRPAAPPGAADRLPLTGRLYPSVHRGALALIRTGWEIVSPATHSRPDRGLEV